jgi:catechol 2,3-dioxygenase-like lactoylglutathione lyase family enzyme
MKIKLTTVYVDDQDKALRFYAEVLGFAKKADFSQGPFRWLTVASPEEPDGTELQLALNDNPAAKAYQQAIFQQGQLWASIRCHHEAALPGIFCEAFVEHSSRYGFSSPSTSSNSSTMSTVSSISG